MIIRTTDAEFFLILCASVSNVGEDLDSQGEGSSQPDTISLASRTSQNTLDSDKVRTHTHTYDALPAGFEQLKWKNALSFCKFRGLLNISVTWRPGLYEFLVLSCPAAVSWLWWYMTSWPATTMSWRCVAVRQWRFWNAVMTNQTGAWSGPQTDLPLRRAWFLAPFSASPIPGRPWRWRASSTTKVLNVVWTVVANRVWSMCSVFNEYKH